MGQISSRVETITVTADVSGTDVLSPDPAEKLSGRPDSAERVSHDGGRRRELCEQDCRVFLFAGRPRLRARSATRDDLDHYGFFNPTAPADYGPFTPVGANNVTIGSVSPYIAAEGVLSHYFRYYLGWRRDELAFDNDDLLHAQNSFQKWVGANSPKATASFLPKESCYAPLISLSFGQAFFTEDPPRRTGTAEGTPVATSHSYQVVASQTLHKTDPRLTLDT
jgi:hypothetical protein